MGSWKGLLALKQKNIKFDRHYERGVYGHAIDTPLRKNT